MTDFWKLATGAYVTLAGVGTVLGSALGVLTGVVIATGAASKQEWGVAALGVGVAALGAVGVGAGSVILGKGTEVVGEAMK